MNRASTMTLNRSNTARSCTDMAGLEEQNGGARWQQEKLLKQGDYGSLYSAPVQLSQVQSFPGFTGGGESAFGEVMIRSVKPNPGLETGWPELGKYEIPNLGFGASGLVKGTEYEMNYAISRTLSCCLPSAKGTESALSEKMRPTAAAFSASSCSCSYKSLSFLSFSKPCVMVRGGGPRITNRQDLDSLCFNGWRELMLPFPSLGST